MTVDVNVPLGDLVTADPRRSRVLEGFGLDYCCNGHRTLTEATRNAGLDVAEVAAALELPAAAPVEEPGQVRANSALAHDIVDSHHAYMWEEMPRLQALVDKVHGVHGDLHPELAQVKETYAAAVAALDPHMTQEERVVFPAISRMEKSGAPMAAGSLAEPIQQLRDEHQVVGNLFRQIRTMTDGYAVPEGACTSYRMMLSGLEEMELDLHEHIHKENNVLFPRALQMEAQLPL
ncbi:iron-sulfur cluster repair di-iron protein [Tessaracoccus antarcticus]|uniref:Iron-sulfur cluster repair di-iron protein n=1 Tax=Tessaracoccus antarcticus TaxID=2479848 RepID=A0A3M0GHN1_9ACTN|nr:iron-sulfur cluster repair di-iron protein [Tessaracoccus antarcticus]RMB62172.1 iron-sulfur cluster repair di-iron protein [Tessaracoccus antarcticus]